MTTPDPFATPDPQRGAWQPDSAAAEPSSGYAAPSYAAPGGAPQPSTAPGFYGPPPSTPQYGQAPYGYGEPQAAPTSTDGPSIAALVTGILGLGVVAIVLGAIGLRRTAGGQRKGSGMAIAGVVLGVIGTIIATAAITWTIAAASSLFDETQGSGGSTGFFDSGAGYGDDAYLDALWDECAAGDDVACDDLYNESPLSSEYEDFGYSCGERGREVFALSCDRGNSE